MAGGQTRSTEGTIESTQDSDMSPRVVQNDTVSPYSPQWTVARVLGALRSVGLAPMSGATTIKSKAMAVPGTVIGIGNGEVQIFIYGDANTAAASATMLARVPSDRFYAIVTAPASHGMISSSPTGRPVVLSTDNLVAIVFSSDSGVHHRVRDALMRNHQAR